MAKVPLPIEFEKDLVAANSKDTTAIMRDFTAGAERLYMVPPEFLHVMEGFNVRVVGTPAYRAGIRVLADSMKAIGFLRTHPITAYVAKEGDESYIYIVGGHRRFEAANLAISEGAPIERLPVILHPAGTNLEDLTLDLLTSNSGQQLSPIEQAFTCQRLIKFDWDEKRIADRLGVTARYVNDLLVLAGSPKKIRDMVIADKVSASTAIKTLRAEGSNAVNVLASGMTAAAAAGKEKVTGKHLSPTGLPRERAPIKAKAASTEDFLRAAILYAISLGVEASDWLAGWNRGDDDCLAALEQAMGQPAGATNDLALRQAWNSVLILAVPSGEPELDLQPCGPAPAGDDDPDLDAAIELVSVDPDEVALEADLKKTTRRNRRKAAESPAPPDELAAVSEDDNGGL